MSLIETVRVAFDALSANKLRSSLTMLGVVIGVASVILLVSIGEGARNYISEQFAGLGTNLLLVTPGKVETKGMLPPVSTTKKLTYGDAEALGRIGYPLRLVAPVVFGTGTAKYRNLHRNTPIIGVTPEFQEARNLRVEVGSFVTDADVEGERKVCVLGRRVVAELFGTSNPLGRMVTLNEARYRVVGIMEKKGVSLGIDLDDVVFIPVKSAQALFNTDRLFEIIVSTATAEEIERGTRIITQTLKKRHDGNEDFTINSQAAMLSTFQTILKSMTFVLAGIASISLVVGGIGIMNIMLVSIKERTKEIGIRKAVGATRRDILSQFLTEAVALSSIGGIIGIIAGGGLAYSLNLLFPALPTSVSAWSVSLAFGFSALVGVFFGVYPAKKAAALDPIEALRYE
jgi:putative ABC transport system permease protein